MSYRRPLEAFDPRPAVRCHWVQDVNPEQPDETQWIFIPGCPTKLDHPDNACTCSLHADDECVRQAAALARRTHRRYIAARRQIAASVLRHLVRYRTCRAHGSASESACPDCATARLAAEIRGLLSRFEPAPWAPEADDDLS